MKNKINSSRETKFPSDLFQVIELETETINNFSYNHYYFKYKEFNSSNLVLIYFKYNNKLCTTMKNILIYP